MPVVGVMLFFFSVVAGGTLLAFAYRMRLNTSARFLDLYYLMHIAPMVFLQRFSVGRTSTAVGSLQTPQTLEYVIENYGISASMRRQGESIKKSPPSSRFIPLDFSLDPR